MEKQRPEFGVELDDDFDRDERLFHYTSSQGLYGILESGCLWATHFKFLNDSNEFFAARSSLIEFVEKQARKKLAALKVNRQIKIKEGVEIKELSSDHAKIVVDVMYETVLKLAAPFVFSCFAATPKSRSFRNGELLHWATYGRHGGYALEFNPHKLALLLKEAREKDGVSFISKRAVYVDEEPPEELRTEYETIGRVAQQMVVGLLNDNLEDVDINQTALPFMTAASIIKDGYFRSEGEARLVAMRYKEIPDIKNPPEILVRHGAMGAVPYIKLFEGMLFGEQSPIEAIIIGPHSDKLRRNEALTVVLESRGLGNIKIFQSEVPYLGG